MLRPNLEKKRTRLRTPVPVKAQVGSFLYYISDDGCYRKTANAFAISRAFISGIIIRVSYAVTTFVRPKLIRLPTTEGKVQELTYRYLEANGFPQCVGVIDETHVEIAEPSEHYSDFINRKGYFSLNVQVVCDYKYCFQDIVVKWPGSVHDARLFLNCSINRMLRNRIIPPCEKILVEERNPVPVFLLVDPA